MKTFKQSIISIVMGLALAASISWAAPWSGPQANPPGLNADAPINVGLLPQTFGSGSSAGSKTLYLGNGQGILSVVANTLGVTGSINVGGLTMSNGAGNGKVLTSNVSGQASWQDATRGGKERFTSIGTFTFSVPAGVTKVWVSMSGGGGGGGGGGQYNAGGGGGGGSVLSQEVPIPNGVTSIPVEVGYGGLQGAVQEDGKPGGRSSFGSFVIANGGSEGFRGTTIGGGVGGNGGSATGGVSGGHGGDRGGSNPGIGGGSIFGNGGDGGDSNVDGWSGRRGGGYGGGGGGGPGHVTNPNRRNNGGDGSPGFVLVEW